MSRRVLALAALAVLVGAAGCVGSGVVPGGAGDGSGPTTPGDDYRTTAVDLVDANGTRLATVDVWVADTWEKRYVGLSDTTALDPGQGMLFVHGSEGTRTYVMRKMDFPLDIVFVAADGTITTVHHAPTPEGGSESREYSGRAKYVLEVPRGYTNETGVDVGDRVRVGDRRTGTNHGFNTGSSTARSVPSTRSVRSSAAFPLAPATASWLADRSSVAPVAPSVQAPIFETARRYHRERRASRAVSATSRSSSALPAAVGLDA
jgi:uncharacterized membrane protein (UPF0127 family)